MGGVDEALLALEHLRRHRRETEDPHELTMMLYGSWYARAQGSVSIPERFPVDLIQALRAADATAREWDAGWVADRVAPDGRVIARRGKEVRMADRCDYVAPGAVGVLPQPGDELILAGRRDRADGGWWQTGGRAWRFTRTPPGLVRLYWSFQLGHLPELVSRVTEALAGHNRPWMLKCATDPEVHTRADATVLYLSWDALEDFAPRVDSIASALRPHARRGAPPLTLPIQPGVAAAVDPGPEESFGEHRCRLLVEAFPSALPDDADAALVAIDERMTAEGLSLDRPYASRADALLPWER